MGTTQSRCGIAAKDDGLAGSDWIMGRSLPIRHRFPVSSTAIRAWHPATTRATYSGYGPPPTASVVVASELRRSASRGHTLQVVRATMLLFCEFARLDASLVCGLRFDSFRASPVCGLSLSQGPNERRRQQMADVFISYSHANRDVARAIASQLTTAGASVWWDRELIVGQDFDATILRELNGARCVVVIWSGRINWKPIRTKRSQYCRQRRQAHSSCVRARRPSNRVYDASHIAASLGPR